MGPWRRIVEEIFAIIERRGIGEHWQGDQLAIDCLRLDDRREVGADDILGRLGQVKQLFGKLWGPDDVRLIDIDVGVADGEPEPVLAELIRRRGRHRNDSDLVAGVLLELIEYLAKNLQAIAGIARYDGQIHRLRRAGRQNDARDKRQNCIAKLHGQIASA